jgi:hypothetical protein
MMMVVVPSGGLPRSEAAATREEHEEQPPNQGRGPGGEDEPEAYPMGPGGSRAGRVGTDNSKVLVARWLAGPGIEHLFPINCYYSAVKYSHISSKKYL